MPKRAFLGQIDSADQSTFLSLETGPQKGGHYSTRNAELAAIDEALQSFKAYSKIIALRLNALGNRLEPTMIDREC